MSGRRIAGGLLLAGLALLFALRIGWVVRHVGDVRPVAGGDLAPDFTLALLRGGEFHLADEPARAPAATVPTVPTVIDFWATWCQPCREELPHVDALWHRVGDRARVVAVDVEGRDAVPAVAQLAHAERLGLPIALGGSEVAESYHVQTLPHLVIVDGAGRIRRVLLGVHDESELLAAVEEAAKPAR